MTKKMVSLIMTLVLACTLLLLLNACGSKTTQLKVSTKTVNKDIEYKLNEVMENFSKSVGFSGSVLVAKDNEILLVSGYGMADYEKAIENKPQTVFLIGSITKQFTATAIMMLQEKGLLNVEDTIDKYIPDYPNGNKIKIYNLLNHTSGIPEYLDFVGPLEIEKNYTPKDLIKLFQNKPLIFDTGTGFQYSNSNYILLGYIIEKLSGMKYEEYLRVNIFEPLDMNNTGFITSKDVIKENSLGYIKISPITKEYTKASQKGRSLPYSAGSIYSTVEDLYLWSNALDTEKLVKKESLNKMFTPFLKDYGFGWFINKTEDGSKVVSHAGNLPGYTSFIARNINTKCTVILLGNKEYDNVVQQCIYSELAEILNTK